MNTDRPERDAISERIVGCAFAVANTLGSGFLEKVYEDALVPEFRAAGLCLRVYFGMPTGQASTHRFNRAR